MRFEAIFESVFETCETFGDLALDLYYGMGVSAQKTSPKKKRPNPDKVVGAQEPQGWFKPKGKWFNAS